MHFISGWTIDCWHACFVQAEIHGQLATVMRHMAKEVLVQSDVSRRFKQNLAAHRKTPRFLQMFIRCRLQGSARVGMPNVEYLQQLGSALDYLCFKRIG